MHFEYKSKGIIVQSLCPGYVDTKLANLSKSYSAISAERYAENAIKTIKTQPLSCGCLSHNFTVN